MSQTTNQKRQLEWLALFAILAVTVFVYSDMWSAPYVLWDDTANIFTNPLFLLNKWWWVWKEPYFGMYVPITSSIWVALLQLGGGATWPFRALNIGLHIANTILVYRLLKLLWQRLELESPWPLFIGVGVFALHPLQVQSVAWISGGRDLLAAFFALSAIFIYLNYSSRRSYASATVLFVLALMSKPNVVVLPVVLMVIETFYFKRPWRVSAGRLAPWLVFSAAAIALTQMGQSPHFEVKTIWWQRPLLMFDSYAFYLSKTLWPENLAVNYAHTPITVMAKPLWWIPSVVMLLFTIGAALWSWLFRDRRWVMGVGWLLFLLPMSGIVPFAYQNIGGTADHYNYLPLMCVAAIIMISFDELAVHRIFAVVPAIILGLLAQMSWQRLEVWQSNTNLYLDMSRTAPDAFSTAIGMSVVMCLEAKNYDLGVQWTEKALALVKNDILALSNQAACYNRAGRYERTLAMVRYLDVLDKPSLRAKAPTAYANFLDQLGQASIFMRELRAGFKYLCESYQVLPSNADHLTNLKAAAEILRKQGIDETCVP